MFSISDSSKNWKNWMGKENVLNKVIQESISSIKVGNSQIQLFFLAVY